MDQPDSHVSGAIDSYYEYLLEVFGAVWRSDCKRMWTDSIAAINKYLADDIKTQWRSSCGTAMRT